MKKLVLFLFALVSCSSFASTTVAGYYVSSAGNGYYPSASGACAAWPSHYPAGYSSAFNSSLVQCTLYNSPTQNSGSQVSVGTVYGPFANKACSGGDQPITTNPPATQCLDTSCPTTGTAGTVAWPTAYVDSRGHQIGSILGAPTSGQSVNVAGCKVTVGSLVSPTNCSSNPAAPYPQLVTCAYNTTSSGYSADGSVPTVPSPTPPPIAPNAQGQCPAGTINGGTDSTGTPICIGQSSQPTPDSSNSTTSKVTNPDNSVTTTTVTTTQNSDGSTTTTTSKNTVNADGSQGPTSKSSTTSNNAVGKPGQSDESSDLCSQHPELNVCQNSTVSGSCANISCTGDAIQCAVLRANADDNCRSHQADTDIQNSDEYKLFSNVKSGNDPLAASLPTNPANFTSYTMPSSLDGSGWLGGGACFPDKTFTVHGQTFTLSFAQACQPLLVFRYALFIVALLVSFRMLSGVILRE